MAKKGSHCHYMQTKFWIVKYNISLDDKLDTAISDCDLFPDTYFNLLMLAPVFYNIANVLIFKFRRKPPYNTELILCDS
jgi:hypothetical protein